MFLRLHTSLNERRAGLKREEGFTLIELLVVVIIIGILAAIAIPVFLGVQSNAVSSAVKSDLTNIKVAAVAFQTSNNGDLPAAGTVDDTNTDFNVTVTIDDGNYGTSGALPVFTPDAGNAGFTVCATGSNGISWQVTDTTSPLEVAAC